MVEEFNNCSRHEIRTCLNEKEVSTLEEAAKFADTYEGTHKKFIVSKPKFKIL